MDTLKVKKPIYPLLSLASAVLILVSGLLLVRQARFPLMLLALCLLYIVFGLASATWRGLLFFLPVSLIFMLFSFLFSRDPAIALQMGSRIMLVCLAALPVLTLPQIHLARNLAQIRCPRLLTLGMLIAIRFVPVLAAEVRQVRAAMKTRGARVDVWNLSCLYRAFLIPLLLRLFSISDTLSLSLETRAFDLRSKDATIYRPIRFQLRDGFYLVALLSLIILMAVYG